MFDCFYYGDGVTRCISDNLYFNAVWLDACTDQDAVDDTGSVLWVSYADDNINEFGTYRMF